MASNFVQAVRNSIFVTNLPWTIGSKELGNYFSKFGPVIRANVIFSKETGLSKRYGFVLFKNDTSVQSAFQTKDHILEGKELNIQLKQKD